MIVKKGRNTVYRLLHLAIIPVLFSSCFLLPAKVKKYPTNKPFVYSNKFILKADSLNKTKRSELKSRIASQLDDSMIVRTLDRAIFQSVIKNPPVFDTNSLYKSVDNIKILMNNLGYFRSAVTATYKIDSSEQYTSQGQYRVTSTFDVDTKKNTLIDSLNYIFPSEGLQKVVRDNMKNSVLKKGEPYTVEKISAERNRLVTDFRNNGYFQITHNDIFALVDTVNKALFRTDLSDFERIVLIAQSKNRRPYINVIMQMRPKADTSVNFVYDSSKLKQYYIGRIRVYPDFNFLSAQTDTLKTKYNKDSTLEIRYRQDKFQTNFIAGNFYFKKGDLYKEDDYARTLNAFNQLGTWQVVNIQSFIDSTQKDSVGVINFAVFLTPARKYSFSANLESSLSTNVTAATGNGNILGFLGNLSLTDRNVGKQGVRITHSVRGGIEFNLTQNGIQNSREMGYSNNIAIPKFMPPFRFLLPKKPYTKSSTVNTNVSSLNRIGFFNLASFNLGLGYEWKNKPNASSIWKPFTIDYSNLYNASDSFIKATQENIFLRNSFQTSLVIGQSFAYAVQLTGKKKENHVTTFKINLEESGLVFGTIKKLVNNEGFLKNLREFVKGDVEVKHFINYKKSGLVFRLFTGVGTPVRGDSGIPFFKQYFAGGPNSMRAWPIRTLGQGGQAYPVYQVGGSRFNDRVGDVQIEANAEYRYDITPLFNNVVTLKGALFMDAGNVWAIKKDKTITSGEDPKVFQFKNLYKQLAVGLGTGFRFDFNYFLVRFDFGFRFKKPDVTENNGWRFPDINLKNLFTAKGREWRYENFNFTFGINYAF